MTPRGTTTTGHEAVSMAYSAEALTILQPVYDRFTEGFDTADLKSAKALLDALGQTGSDTTPDAAGPTPVRAR